MRECYRRGRSSPSAPPCESWRWDASSGRWKWRIRREQTVYPVVSVPSFLVAERIAVFSSGQAARTEVCPRPSESHSASQQGTRSGTLDQSSSNHRGMGSAESGRTGKIVRRAPFLRAGSFGMIGRDFFKAIGPVADNDEASDFQKGPALGDSASRSRCGSWFALVRAETYDGEQASGVWKRPADKGRGGATQASGMPARDGLGSCRGRIDRPRNDPPAAAGHVMQGRARPLA